MDWVSCLAAYIASGIVVFWSFGWWASRRTVYAGSERGQDLNDVGCLLIILFLPSFVVFVPFAIWWEDRR